MKLEDQVVSLELAMRLKELGVKQNSFFTWVKDFVTGDYKLNTFERPFYGSVKNYWAAGFNSDEHPMFDAFTVAELGEMLQVGPRSYSWKGEVTTSKWVCHLKEFEYVGKGWEEADTEADARAKMLIHLIEKGIAKP